MPRAPVRALLAALALLTAAGCREDDDTGAPWSKPATSSSSTGSAGGEGGGPTAPLPTEPLAILNWNTRNFFNTRDDTPGTDEIVLSAAAYREKREAVAAVIKAIDPDIAVLQEVENLSVLEELNQNELAGAYPYAALIDGNDQRGIDIGALSKIPLDQVVSHKDDRFTEIGTQGPIHRYARDCVELHVTHGGRKVILLGVHFISKASADNDDKRLAEAQHTRGIADALAMAEPSAAIVVLGDFNDVPGSPAYKAVAGAGASAFQSAATGLPEEARWSYDYEGQLQLIDHQMANPVLSPMLDPASVQLLHSPEVERASDHAPLLAVYRVTPAQ